MDLDDILIRIEYCQRRADDQGLEHVWAHLYSAAQSIRYAMEELEKDTPQEIPE